MRVQTKKGGVFAGALFGVLMLIGSVVMLWVNEGRADLSKVAQDAIVVTQGTAPAEAQGQLVAITGRLEIDEAAFDADFGVRGDYVELNRKVEMYAWDEDEDDDKYSYDTEWTTSPENSDGFEYPAGHENLRELYQRYPATTFHAQTARVNGYTFDPSRAHLTSAEGVRPGSDLRLPQSAYLTGDYIYIGYYGPYTATNQTMVGDVRISYTAVQAGRTVSLYGLLQGDQVEPFVKDNAKLYGTWAGSHDEALAAMHQEYVMIGWIMRVGGFMLMWFGLNLLVSPLTNLLGFIPVLGRLGRGIIWGINFVIALVVSLVIMLVSFVAHRWYLILVVFLVGVGVAVFFVLRQRKKAAV
jgi:hypothetical protein